LDNKSWLTAWLKSGPRVADGAMGTMLQRLGLPLSELPESWNLSQTEKVRAVHAAYRAAGAEWLQTNSFGGNRWRLRHAGLAEQVAPVNRAAVELARSQTGANGPWVAGTLGPTGARLGPGRQAGAPSQAAAASSAALPPENAALTCEAAGKLFAEQAEVLAAAGADLLVIETMSNPREAEAAILGARSRTALPVVATLTFGPDGRTVGGEDAVAAVERLLVAGAVAAGGNCGHGPASLLPVIRQLRRAYPSLPLVAQPSLGLPRLVEGWPVYDLSPAGLAEWGCRLAEAGADLIGGCCGSTPEHIDALRKALSTRR
jgi:5-methyltetrahydrofolate--homocysteine methyltransferase